MGWSGLYQSCSETRGLVGVAACLEVVGEVVEVVGEVEEGLTQDMEPLEDNSETKMSQRYNFNLYNLIIEEDTM